VIISFKEINENCKTIGDVFELSKKEQEMKNILKKAEQIAREFHKGQKRIYGEDYITHPEAVANSFEDDKYKIVSWLHDILEDTTLQPEDLEEKGIPKKLIQSIIYLTRLPDENYKDYILKIKEDEIATKVKIADLKDNLKDLKRGNMRDKYILALNLLKEK